MKSVYTLTVSLICFGLLAPLILSADGAAPAASTVSKKEYGQAVRERAMGPDVKLANPFRYQPPPVPLRQLPRVTQNLGVGPTIRLLHPETVEGGQTEPAEQALTDE